MEYVTYFAESEALYIPNIQCLPKFQNLPIIFTPSISFQKCNGTHDR
jgi:hypothetical protein